MAAILPRRGGFPVSDIKAQRKLVGWTQFRLANESGISRMKISLAECGEATLSTEEEAAIRRALTNAIKARAAEIRSMLSAPAVEATA
jgi:transcriptional regulator with XRE-family HTH domain